MVKKILLSAFAFALFPCAAFADTANISPGADADSLDGGTLQYSNVLWPSAYGFNGTATRFVDTGDYMGDNTFRIFSNLTGGVNYNIGRGYQVYDLSSNGPLPSDACITDGYFMAVPIGHSNPNHTQQIGVYESSPLFSITDLQAFSGDMFNRRINTAITSGVYADDYATDAAGSGTVTWPLNATGINYMQAHVGTGVSISFLTSNDATNTAPTSDLGYFEQRFDASDAQLILDYYTGGCVSSSASSSTSGSGSSSSAPYIASFTGALVFAHAACNHFTSAISSGGVVTEPITCDGWDASIDIPFIASMQRQFAYIQYSTLVLTLKWLLVFFLVFISGRWMFRIVTHYKPSRHRRK